MLVGRATFSFDILMDPLLFFLLCSFYVSKFFESRKDIGEWAIERKKRKKGSWESAHTFQSDWNELPVRLRREPQQFSVFNEKVEPITFNVGHFQMIPDKLVPSGSDTRDQAVVLAGKTD